MAYSLLSARRLVGEVSLLSTSMVTNFDGDKSSGLSCLHPLGKWLLAHL